MTLVRRINQLYHDLTQDEFDSAHRHRHAVERRFWWDVRQLLNETGEPESPGRLLVDLACGTGFVTQILEQVSRPQDRLVVLDLSRAALASTIRKCTSKRIVPVAADAAALPLDSGSVDLLALNAALHHMPDPSGVLREVDRVLKPGGYFALGFEPNSRHFSSVMGTFSRGLDRLAWYSSPRQNVRRLRCRLGLSSAEAQRLQRTNHVTQAINDVLLREQVITRPLSCEAMFDHLDPHARGTRRHAGFDAFELIRNRFPGYDVRLLMSCDYLGEAARRLRPLRDLADATLRIILPTRGSLFSCVVRKPALDRTVKGGRKS